jgi:hypothetical protein
MSVLLQNNQLDEFKCRADHAVMFGIPTSVDSQRIINNRKEVVIVVMLVMNKTESKAKEELNKYQVTHSPIKPVKTRLAIRMQCLLLSSKL